MAQEHGEGNAGLDRQGMRDSVEAEDQPDEGTESNAVVDCQRKAAEMQN